MTDGITCSSAIGTIKWTGTAPEKPEDVLRRVEENLNLKVYSGYLLIRHYDSQGQAVDRGGWGGELVSDANKDGTDRKVVVFDRGAKIAYKKDGETFFSKPKGATVFSELTESAEKGLFGTNFSSRDTLTFINLAKNYRISNFSYSPEGKGSYYFLLIAKSKKEHYFKQEIVVDKETGIPLVTKFYPRMGLPLKTMTMDTKNLYKITGKKRYYPQQMEFRECGGQNTITKVTITGIKEETDYRQRRLFN